MGPFVTFFIGLGLLALFLWYFATDSATKKRYIGTFLAILLTLFCVWAFNPPKDKIQLGIDLRGGVAFILQVQGEAGETVTQGAREQAIKVLSRRLNALGTKDMLIAPQGEDRIMVQMPGVSPEEVAEIEKILAQTAELHFAMVHPQSARLVPGIDAGQHIEPGYEVKDNTAVEGERILIKIRPDMPGTYVKNAGVRYGQEGWIVALDFTSDGSDKFGKLTGDAFRESQQDGIDRRLGIVMDGEVISAPVVRAAIYGQCVISGGDMDALRSRALASALQNPLERPVEVLNKYEVSPTMGADTIKQGIYAGLAGLAITLLFVLLYYKFAGIVALVGLTVNIALLFGALAIFQFTLTLPGIAGIILTIGIAIDANVLIYERLREELHSGKSLSSAIDAAYSKAFSAIFDANITTLIAAVMLFYFASGTVRGFAVTLMVGIVASLFSALLVTRVCFGWAVSSGLLKKINLWSLIPEKNLDFLGKRRFTAIASLVLIVGTLVLLGVKQDEALGVDFRGGDLITLKIAEPISNDQLEDSLGDLELGGEWIPQHLNSAGEGEFLTIRAPFGNGDMILDELRKDFGLEFKDATIESVGPVIGQEMLKSSLIALGVGMLCIFIYVAFRFEFAFAIGAIVALLHDITITLGVLMLFNQEISLILVGAFLSIAGYSINDTIVVFDRIREGLRSKRGEVVDIMNLCLNQTLSRTLLTSLTTLIVVVSLYFFGGPALNSFAFTIIIGVLIGTYSSIFIAAPIVLWWARTRKLNLRREILDTDQAAVKPIGGGQA